MDSWTLKRLIAASIMVPLGSYWSYSMTLINLKSGNFIPTSIEFLAYFILGAGIIILINLIRSRYPGYATTTTSTNKTSQVMSSRLWTSDFWLKKQTIVTVLLVVGILLTLNFILRYRI